MEEVCKKAPVKDSKATMSVNTKSKQKVPAAGKRQHRKIHSLKGDREAAAELHGCVLYSQASVRKFRHQVF